MNPLMRSARSAGAARLTRLLLAASLALSTPFFAQAGDPGSERWDRWDQTSLESLKEIERRRVKALVDGNLDVAGRLHADDFQLINPSGGALSKSDYLGGLETGFIDYLVWEPGAIDVRRNGDTAVLRYQSQLQIVILGQVQPLASYWHTDYYERRRGRWQVVWSHATQIVN
jgi:hypothetical protein